MRPLNNKGQSLVMFILIIPIILMILSMIYDIGNALYEKETLNNINYMTIDYGLDNMDKITESDLIELILKNTNNLEKVDVKIENNTINITISKRIKGLFGKILDTDIINAVSTYKGKIEEGKKKIERVKW